MEVKELLKQYHPEYQESEETLHDAEEAIQDLKERIGAGDCQQRGDLFRGRYKTIGESVIRRFIEQGEIRFIEERVSSPEQLAVLMQAYRNPLFETMRFVYLKNEIVVAVEGYTNRLPSVVVMPTLKEDHSKHIRSRMEQMQADQYYIVHNHPSGDPTPSWADREFTYHMAHNTSGFAGHVVTNHTRYGLIDAEGEPRILDMESPRKDLFAGATIPHPLLGDRIRSNEDVAKLGRRLQSGEKSDVTSLIYCSAQNDIRMIQEVQGSMLSEKEFPAWLAEQSRSVGGVNVFCHTMDTEVYAICEPLIHERYLVDAVFTDRDYPFFWSKREEGVQINPAYLFAGTTLENLDHHTTFQDKKPSKRNRSQSSAQKKNNLRR